MLVSSRTAANEELKGADAWVNQSRQKIRERQEKEVGDRQSLREEDPTARRFTETTAATAKVAIADSVDRPDTAHGKQYNERQTTVHLKNSGLGPDREVPRAARAVELPRRRHAAQHPQALGGARLLRPHRGRRLGGRSHGAVRPPGVARDVLLQRGSAEEIRHGPTPPTAPNRPRPAPSSIRMKGDRPARPAEARVSALLPVLPPHLHLVDVSLREAGRTVSSRSSTSSRRRAGTRRSSRSTSSDSSFHHGREGEGRTHHLALLSEPGSRRASSPSTRRARISLLPLLVGNKSISFKVEAFDGVIKGDFFDSGKQRELEIHFDSVDVARIDLVAANVGFLLDGKLNGPMLNMPEGRPRRRTAPSELEIKEMNAGNTKELLIKLPTGGTFKLPRPSGRQLQHQRRGRRTASPRSRRSSRRAATWTWPATAACSSARSRTRPIST